MAVDSALETWLFLPALWVALAIVLVGADMLFGFHFFVLSIGVACLILAGLLFAQQGPWAVDEIAIGSWRGLAVWFAALSVASVLLIKGVFQRRRGRPDINEY